MKNGILNVIRGKDLKAQGILPSEQSMQPPPPTAFQVCLPEIDVSRGADRISNTESHVVSSTLLANFIPSLLAGGSVLGFL